MVRLTDHAQDSPLDVGVVRLNGVTEEADRVQTDRVQREEEEGEEEEEEEEQQYHRSFV